MDANHLCIVVVVVSAERSGRGRVGGQRGGVITRPTRERSAAELGADRIAGVRREEERHASDAHVAAPEALARERVDLRVREEVPDALRIVRASRRL